MEEVFVINPKRLQEFVEFMTKKSNLICENQEFVEKQFVKLGEGWDDHVYNVTGANLADTSKSIGRVHEVLADSVKVATKYYNRYIEIQGYKQFLPERKVNEYRTVFRNGEFMSDGFNKNATTDLGAMSTFIKGLGDYVVDTTKIMEDLKKEYEAMGKDKAWKAKQYDKLGEVLYDVDKKIAKQLDALLICKRMIEIKHKDLVDLANNGFKGL